MEHISNENVVCFDCDDTLMMWGLPKPTHEIGGIGYTPHKRHIESLKRFSARGQFVIVWSAGGAAWAKKVVETLNLEPYVNLTMAKPSWLFDDRPLSELGALCYYDME